MGKPTDKVLGADYDPRKRASVLTATLASLRVPENPTRKAMTMPGANERFRMVISSIRGLRPAAATSRLHSRTS